METNTKLSLKHFFITWVVVGLCLYLILSVSLYIDLIANNLLSILSWFGVMFIGFGIWKCVTRFIVNRYYNDNIVSHKGVMAWVSMRTHEVELLESDNLEDVIDFSAENKLTEDYNIDIDESNFTVFKHKQKMDDFIILSKTECTQIRNKKS